MRYPVMTLIDETEITASMIEENGQYQIYVEKWSVEHDDFDHFTVQMPELVIIESKGYSDKDRDEIFQHITNLQQDITDFVKECMEEELCHNY